MDTQGGTLILIPLVVAQLYFSHCSPSRLPLSKDASVRQKAMQDIQTILQSWNGDYKGLKLSNETHHLSLTLEVCYQ